MCSSDLVGNVYYDISDADFTTTAPADSSAILISAVVNAASFAPTVGPNTFFTLAGTNLGTAETPKAGSTTAGGATVTFCGTAAVLPFNSGAGTINGLTPDSIKGQTSCPVVVTVGGKSSPTFTLPISAQALGIFQFASGGVLLPVATHADFKIVGPASAGLTPAASGETLILFCTGWNPGATNPLITVGGANATVAYYGASSSTGLCQINFVVPANLGAGANNMTVGDLGPFPLTIKTN